MAAMAMTGMERRWWCVCATAKVMWTGGRQVRATASEDVCRGGGIGPGEIRLLWLSVASALVP
jgi:hypothetical protein